VHVVRRHDAADAAPIELARGRVRAALGGCGYPRHHQQESGDEEEEVHADHAVARDDLRRQPRVDGCDPRIGEARVEHHEVMEDDHEQDRDPAQPLDRGDVPDLGANAQNGFLPS
jgi:hypothetical protein